MSDKSIETSLSSSTNFKSLPASSSPLPATSTLLPTAPSSNGFASTGFASANSKSLSASKPGFGSLAASPIPIELLSCRIAGSLNFNSAESSSNRSLPESKNSLSDKFVAFDEIKSSSWPIPLLSPPVTNLMSLASSLAIKLTSLPKSIDEPSADTKSNEMTLSSSPPASPPPINDNPDANRSGN